jgi:hypothetical protein
MHDLTPSHWKGWRIARLITQALGLPSGLTAIWRYRTTKRKLRLQFFRSVSFFLFLVLLLPAGTLYDAGYPKPSSSVIDAGDSV